MDSYPVWVQASWLYTHAPTFQKHPSGVTQTLECEGMGWDDSGCPRLLRLPGWHHHPEADGEGTRARQKQCNDLHSHTVGRSLVICSYLTYRRSGCVVSLAVQLEERKQGFWCYSWTFPNSSTTIKSGDQETFWREILQKLLRIFKFSCTIFDLNLQYLSIISISSS